MTFRIPAESGVTCVPSKLLFVCSAEGDRVRHSGVNSTRPDHVLLDPIVDDLIARTKSFGHLLDSQLLRLLELSRWNPIVATDPLDDFHRVRPAFCAGLSLAIELIGDLTIGHGASQFSN